MTPATVVSERPANFEAHIAIQRDIDVLVLGDPDRDEVFARIRPVEERLGRPVQLTFRSTRWLDEGEGAFHDTVVGRPMVEVPLSVDGSRNGDKGG